MRKLHLVASSIDVLRLEVAIPRAAKVAMPAGARVTTG
jgi:hypothetical protein